MRCRYHSRVSRNAELCNSTTHPLEGGNPPGLPIDWLHYQAPLIQDPQELGKAQYEQKYHADDREFDRNAPEITASAMMISMTSIRNSGS